MKSGYNDMSTVLIILLPLLIFMIVTSLLRIRVRLNLSSDSKTLFVGVGQTGITADLVKGMGRVSFGGITFKPRLLKWKIKAPQVALKTIPKIIRALWRFFISILKSFTIEQLEGELNAGFPEPHMTGYAYGFYQAAFAGIPGATRRFRFIPDWTGGSFGGRINVAVSIPIYRIIYRSIVLFFELPFRELIKMAIGRKARLERSRKDRKQNEPAK